MSNSKKHIDWNPQLPEEGEIPSFEQLLNKVENRQAAKPWKKYLLTSIAILFCISVPIVLIHWNNESLNNNVEVQTATEELNDENPINDQSIAPDTLQVEEQILNNEVKPNDKPPKTTVKKEVKKVKPFKATAFTTAEPLVGYDSLYRYLNKEIEQLLLYRNKIIDITIMVKFNINAKGQCDNIVMVEDELDPDLSDSLIAIILDMPQWRPATVNGEPIQTTQQIPIVLNFSQIESEKENSSELN